MSSYSQIFLAGCLTCSNLTWCISHLRMCSFPLQAFNLVLIYTFNVSASLFKMHLTQSYWLFIVSLCPDLNLSVNLGSRFMAFLIRCYILQLFWQLTISNSISGSSYFSRVPVMHDNCRMQNTSSSIPNTIASELGWNAVQWATGCKTLTPFKLK